MHGSKIAWLVLVGCFAWWGCGQSQPVTVADAETTEPEETPTDSEPFDSFREATSNPGTTVALMLQSLRDGNHQTTSRLLTAKARNETAKYDMVVSPPGSPSAQFTVGQIAYINSARTGAHVESHWIDVDETGKKISYEIIWILRRQPQGWGVAGMATELFAGESPLVMNFEDPQEMMVQQQRAELELARRSARSYREIQTATHIEPVD